MSQPDITPPWEHGLSDEDHEAYSVGVREGIRASIAFLREAGPNEDLWRPHAAPADLLVKAFPDYVEAR